MTIIYKIEFYSYWHAGSGLSGAANVDSGVHKDNGFPFIPGKTLKGLLREGAETIMEFGNKNWKDFIQDVFGLQPKKKKKENSDAVEDYNRLAAKSFFSNAYLSNELIKNSKDIQSYFYDTKASTAINERGIAEDSSLRQIEVTIPVSLYATIEDFPKEYLEEMKQTMQWIKRMGHQRNRGLGRCQFSIIKTIT